MESLFTHAWSWHRINRLAKPLARDLVLSDGQSNLKPNSVIEQISHQLRLLASSKLLRATRNKKSVFPMPKLQSLPILRKSLPATSALESVKQILYLSEARPELTRLRSSAGILQAARKPGVALIRLKTKRDTQHFNEFEPIAIGEGIWDMIQVPPGERGANNKPRTLELESIQVRQSGLAHNGEQAFFPDPGLHPSNYLYSRHPDYWVHSEEENQVLLASFAHQSAEYRVPEGIFVPSRAPNNWFHWWFEVMPLAIGISSVPRNVPLIFSNPPPREFANLLAVMKARPYKVLGGDIPGCVTVSKCWLVPPAIGTRDSFTLKHRTTTSWVDYSFIKQMQNLIPANPLPERPRRVFLARDSGWRSVTNSAELQRLLVKKGFEVVDPVKLTLEDQMKVVSGAETIVTAGGAIAANFMFLAPHSTVIQLVSTQNLWFQAPAAITHAVGGRLITVEGSSPGPDKYDSLLKWQHANFRISPQALMATIEQFD